MTYAWLSIKSAMSTCGFACLLVLLISGTAGSETLDLTSDAKVERYPSGQIKRQYDESEHGYEGAYLSWHANGTAAIKGSYNSGKKHGVWKEWDQDGMPTRDGQYEDDVFTGRVWKRPDALTEIEETWIDGLLLQPESRDGLLRMLNRARDPYRKRSHASDGQQAISRLQGYRAMAGVPFRLRWSDAAATVAMQAASLCKELDAIPDASATPTIESAAPKDVTSALEAIRTSAMDTPAHTDGPSITSFPAHRGRGLPLWFSVDRMVASKGDETLRSRLVCLDPLATSAAIAKAGPFVSLRTLAEEGKNEAGKNEGATPTPSAIYWPPRGQNLRTHFTRNALWSVFLCAKRFAPLDPDALSVTAVVFKHAPKSARHLHLGENVVVDRVHAWHPGTHPHLRAIRFLPRLVDTRRGSACYITISGIATADKKPETLRYFVIFD